ncbi:MAG: AbrB/MazE/SpoVT family DNA-binding domain-containing protein [Caulobacteraceae bacterium]|nr:AbrB/MazE/SpoVT family DNA-binding domain-containing protein [Caulobacter sp.]
MASAVTQKGQVTIPKAVRDAMGVKPGTLVDVQSDGEGGARIVKVEPPASEVQGFARFLGIAPDRDGLSTDEYMAMIRDPIDA